jgi:dienelactone hydrolase
MERPSLNPSVVLETAKGRPAPKASVLRRIGGVVLRALGLLLVPLPGSRAREAEEHSALVRVTRAIVFRLAAVPVVLALLVGALVYTGTHPPALPLRTDPSSLGLYFQEIRVTASDGVISPAWLVPTLDARRVLEDRDAVLTMRRPAIVLVHDQPHARQQMLAYLRPLHSADVVSLVVAVRAGETDAAASRTFGLLESRDVLAAVAMLRTRPTVDGDRIGVLGIGTGATAALLAASADQRIRVVAAINPASDAASLLEPLSTRRPALSFLNPLVRVAFETAWHVDADDADLTRLTTALRDRDVLYLLPEDLVVPNHHTMVTHFLTSRLSLPARDVATSAP